MQQAQVLEWQQAHFTDGALADSANGRASGSEVVAAYTVAGAAATGGPFLPTAMPPLPMRLSRRPHQSGPTTGEGGQAEAIAPTPTVADQPHWPPAPALDEVYALEVATSEAAAIVPDAGMLPHVTRKTGRLRSPQEAKGFRSNVLPLVSNFIRIVMFSRRCKRASVTSWL